MKENELFEIIGNIDDNKIERAYVAKSVKKNFFLLKRASLAACFILIVVVGFSLKSEKTAENIPEKKKITVTEETKAEDAIAETEIITSETGKQKNSTDSFPDNGMFADGEERKADAEKGKEEAEAGSATTEDSEITEEAAADNSPGYSSGGGGSSSSYSKTSEISAFFGGSYIDENKGFVVVLTEDTEENRRAVCRYFGRSTEDTVFEKGEFTLWYLTELQEKISRKMANGDFPFVASSAVVETKNRIEVSVITNDENELEKVKSLDTKGGAIEFKISSQKAELQ